MHRKACGFIDYHELVVVVNDATVDSLRPTIWNTFTLFPFGDRDGRYSNDITSIQFAFRLGSSLIDANLPRPDRFVDSCFRDATQYPHQVVIKALTRFLVGQLNELNSGFRLGFRHRALLNSLIDESTPQCYAPPWFAMDR